MVAFLLALALAVAPAPGPLPAPRAETSPATPDEATVRGLVARWLDAQNKGDFPAYRALYGPSFHGIRRSGGRTVVLDHEGWLRDRERMFKKPMKVAATDLRVTRERAFAQATFVQEFSSGTYADRGRKQIDVAVIAGAPLIAREELLESQRLPGKTRSNGGKAETIDDHDCPTAKTAPFTGTFRGAPGWFVLGDTSAHAPATVASALKLEATGVEAHPIATDMFAGLKPGLFVVVHGAFATRAEAQARADALGTKKVRAYVKESGPLRGAGRLVEIRGVVARNGTPGRWPVQVSVDDGGEGTLTSAADGRFVLWIGAVGLVRIENLAPEPTGHDMRAPAEACFRLGPSSRGRIDLGTLDTTTWLCGQ